VLKPVALTGSRGVIRADDEPALVAAFNRLRSIVKAPDIRAERSVIHDTALVEGFIAGREFAVEGLMTAGSLRILAIFDKPDPLDGPFFEETIYVTPSSAPSSDQAAIIGAVTQAAEAIGLRHGPIHAECRLNDEGVFVLEVAARPIGGLCARVLQFVEGEGSAISFEELLLRHAAGQNIARYERETGASAVMMIPIPRRGVLRSVTGLDQARAVRGIDDVRITAKSDQVLVPLPEGNSYLGFIFAHADDPSSAVAALRAAHARLVMDIEPEVRVLQSVHG
jgi:biotin carboxylase